MSAILERGLTAEQRLECEKHDAAMAAMVRRGTVKKSVTGVRLVEVVSAEEPANEVFPLPEPRDFSRTFKQIEDEANAVARAIVRGVSPSRLRQFEDARERMGVER